MEIERPEDRARAIKRAELRVELNDAMDRLMASAREMGLRPTGEPMSPLRAASITGKKIDI